MSSRRIVVAGGGAAGIFAAITCAEAGPDAEVIVLEKGPQFLAKVKISGGGRCNVTHACFDAREMSARYPRGERALFGAFRLFQAADTVAWFEERGVKLKTEADGRMFPTTDSSQTIIDCLLNAAKKAGVQLRANCGLEQVRRRIGGGFELVLSKAGAHAEKKTNPLPTLSLSGKGDGEKSGDGTLACDCLLLATGGCRVPAAARAAVSLGHTLEPPVPSLFTFHLETPWVRALAGVTVESAEASVPGAGLRERGALLLTHWGLSGPVILRLSAWGARELHGLDYQFPLHVNWLPDMHAEKIASEFAARRESQPARLVVNSPLPPLSARLWEQLVLSAGVPRETRWAAFSRSSGISSRGSSSARNSG